jgi:hypothetical protein
MPTEKYISPFSILASLKTFVTRYNGRTVPYEQFNRRRLPPAEYLNFSNASASLWQERFSTSAAGRASLSLFAERRTLALEKFKADRLGSSKMVLYLREAMRAIASLGCEGAMRAIATSMSPHASPQQGTTPIFSAATSGGITTVQTVSAAAKALPTTETRETQIAARANGYYTDRPIFTLLR